MKKTIYILTLVLAIVYISGCSKLEDFGDTNINPAATNTPITSALLTNVLSGIGGWSSHTLCALYCQYISETQYPDASCYSLNMASPMGNYSGVMYDLENIIINNTDEATRDVAALNGANENQIAIARIIKAYMYWNLTDHWGDIPYTDALKGDPNVTFDTQEVIYKGVIKEMTQAIAQFKTGGAAVKGDIIYGGDIAKWKKFANSCRMLMALRLSKQYPGASDYAATEFKAALADAAGSISTNADNFVVKYPGGNFRNPYYNMYDGRKDFGESATLANLLVSINDNRQGVFGATVTGAPSTLGVPYGRARTYIDPWCQANPTYCYVFNLTYREQTDPIFVITAAHTLLARAEAADRGWTSETANTNTLYQNGIKAAFAQWDLTEPNAAYLAGASVALPAAPGTNANLAQIATQQWIAYYPDGTQGWSNWRRTNTPVLTPAPDATNSPKVIPRRIMYGTADYTLAKTGVEAAVARITGGDKMDSKVWWDK